MSTIEISQSNKQVRKKRISTRLPISSDTGKGLLCDISLGGMFIVQNATQEVGSRISFSILLNTHGKTMKLSCEGTVVRVEEVDGKIGVGVEIIRQFGKQLLSDNLRISGTAWDEVE